MHLDYLNIKIFGFLKETLMSLKSSMITRKEIIVY